MSLVHNDWLAEQIREAHPEAAVDVVEMGVPEPASRPDARRQIRARHAIAEDAVVFTAFGKVTPEKRLREAMRALGSMLRNPFRTHIFWSPGNRSTTMTCRLKPRRSEQPDE